MAKIRAADRQEYNSIFDDLCKEYDKKYGPGYGAQYRKMKDLTEPLIGEMQLAAFNAVTASAGDADEFMQNIQKLTSMYGNVFGELFTSGLMQHLSAQDTVDKDPETQASLKKVTDTINGLFMMGILKHIAQSMAMIMSDKGKETTVSYSYRRGEDEAGNPVEIPLTASQSAASQADDMLASLLAKAAPRGKPN